MAIRILLVEDDAPTRRRLADALASDPDFQVTAVDCLADARAAIASHPPHVMLTDLELPDGHGADLTAEVHAAYPSIEILVVSVLCDEHSVVSAIAAGASGYVLKDALPKDIGDTIREVLEGHSPISAGIARYLLRRLRPAGLGTGVAGAAGVSFGGQPASTPGYGLTTRELDILYGIAKGLSYNEIAENLGLSKKTVPNYIKSVYRKLEVNSRGEAVFEAVSRRLITL